MRIPVKWLSEFVDLKGVTDAQLSDALTLTGTENEILKKADFPGIVVGEILEIEKHHNADKLQITKVSVGPSLSAVSGAGKKTGNTILQIVCGAPNIEVGQKVPVALVGADMGEFQIKEAEIRGVKSFGMLCSESELGISDDHSGIMVLDPRSKVGRPLGEVLGIGGTIIEAELTPNRSDCFSIIGVAREASASLDKKILNLNFKKSKVSTSKKVSVEVREEKLCPRYVAKVVEGVKIGPSPKWMQEKLEAAGIRPINNVVDITNFVMLEWGQPMHAFDMTKLQIENDKYQIIVRRAKKGETIQTLDGTKRTLNEKDLVIADGEKAIAVAGVMGGANSEVDEKTTAVVLEAAVFDGVSVRKTAQRLGLRTEASNRFEKGIPLQLPELAIERAASLLVEISGGLTGKVPAVISKAGENTDILSAWPWIQHIGVTGDSVREFLGIKISDEKIIDILTALGFEAERFDVKNEARKHIGKPYIFGAKFKTHGDMAFDCSYLTDYIYHQIGKFIGYTSLAQYKIGIPVPETELAPGDILFVKGHIDKSVTDHYFVPDGSGGYEKVVLAKPEEVGHNAIYIGNGRIVHARHFEYDSKSKAWKKLAVGKVVEESLDVFTKNPEYLGARRFVEPLDGYIAITVPWWRLDVKNKEDIFEEVGRIYGYDKLPSVLPNGNLPVFEDNITQKLSRGIKGVLMGIGFSEVYNYSFVSAKIITGIGGTPANNLRLKNPISPELEYMRADLSGSLLKNISANQDEYKDINIFEIANVYNPQKDSLPKEEKRLCLAARSSSKTKGQAFYDLKGAIETVLCSENLGVASYRQTKAFYLDNAQEIIISGVRIGIIGMVSQKTRDAFGLKVDTAVAELQLEEMLSFAGKAKEFRPISKFPTAARDISVVVDQKVEIGAIERAIAESKSLYLLRSEILDIYEGKGLLPSQKSVTISLVFGSTTKTLLDADINQNLEKIVRALEKLGGTIRS